MNGRSIVSVFTCLKIPGTANVKRVCGATFVVLFGIWLNPAVAEEQAGSPATRVGKTLLSLGSVSSVRASQTVTLKRRSPILEGDEVRVGGGSRAQFRMIDAAIISLQENSILQIKQYRYRKDTPGNSALMELLAGGLRTITGAIGKDNQKAYELRTPLATIGIRGTDYEVEIVANGMYVGVWEGVIHLRSLLKNGCSMELGKARRFSFVFIDRFGQCRGLDEAPDVFESGHSYAPDELLEITAKESLYPYRAFTIDQSSPSQNGKGRASELNTSLPTFQVGNQELTTTAPAVSNYQQSIGGYPVSWGYWASFDAASSNASAARNVSESSGEGLLWSVYEASDAQSVMSRSGQVRYETVADSLVSGSVGPVTNLAVQMDVDFDNGNVSNGAISANTPAETWIGVFDGKVDQGDLSLQLNGASVVDSNPGTPSPPRDVSGFIDGDFVGESAQAILGAFGLSENENAANHIEGVFLLE